MHALVRSRIIHQLTAFLFILLPLCGCQGSSILVLSEIQGPGALNEHSGADYSVDVTGGTVVAYVWTIDPAAAGAITNATATTCTFQPGEVRNDTTVKIIVTVTGVKSVTWVESREITVIDTNQMPRAAAHSDKTRIGHGQSVQFFDDSTDPEGYSDIVKWEWDFSFDSDDGFRCECEECEPLHRFDDPGIYSVQLRITDRSSITDTLNQPLTIEVAENDAPIISLVTHSRTTSRMGDDGEAVQLGVEFADASPAHDTHTFSWTCDYGSFDDESSESPIWFPPNQVVDCDISVRVIDWFGLSDEATCHQWVSSLSTRFNSTAPGNVIPSRSLQTAFGGPVNPAGYVFPNNPNDGTVVLISYWATFSSASTDGMPELQNVYSLYASSNYVHFMINEGETAKTVSDYVILNNCQASYWALDQDAAYFGLTKGWANNSNSLPQTFLFDRDGHCRWVHVGKLTYTGDLQSAIEELL
jgi:PKD repeat protein